MKISPKEVNRTVKLLEDPRPGWMALVDNGANQVPFNVVKRDGIKRKSSKEGSDMALKGKGAKAPATRLTKMTFSKTLFPTKKSVKDYLSEKNIDDTGEITLDTTDDMWVVESSEDFSALKLGKPRSTATKQKGVTAFIAPVLSSKEADEADEEEEDEDEDGEEENAAKSDADEEEEEEEEDEDDTASAQKKGGSRVKSVETKAKKTVKPLPGKAKKATTIEPILRDEGGEIAQKYDFWGAYTSDEGSLLGVLSDGMSYDNVPPGMEDVMMAAFTAMGNIFSNDSTVEEKRASLLQMGTELADVGMGLFTLFTSATEDATKAVSRKTRNAAGEFVENFSASIDRATSEDYSGFVDNVDNEDDEPAAKSAKGKEPAKTKKAAADPDKMPAWASGLVNQVKGLASTVKGVSEELARAPAKKSMSESLDEIVGDEEEEDEEAITSEARLQEIRRSMGLAPVSS